MSRSKGVLADDNAPPLQRIFFLEQHAPMARQKFEPGPIPTLGELRVHTCWVWVHCEAMPDGVWCSHKTPLPLALPIILYGPNASSNALRQRARCTRCGTRGATLRLPSHVDSTVSLAPFPIEATPGAAMRL